MNRKLLTLGLLLTLFLFPHNSLAQTLHTENFEANTPDLFSHNLETNGVISTSSTEAHSGTYSFKSDISVAGGAASGYWLTTDNHEFADSYTRIWAFIPTASATEMDLNGEYWTIAKGTDWTGAVLNWELRFYNSGGTDLIVFFYNGYGNNDSIALAGLVNEWICLEVYVNNGTDKVEWWVNGVSQGADTTANIVDANTGCLFIGAIGSSGVTGHIFIDDVVWDDSRYIGTGWRVQESGAVGSHYQY